MAKRVYFDSLYLKLLAGGLGSLGVGLFVWLAMVGAIDIEGYSGDTTCAGTIDNPCYAYINFTAKEDIFIYPFNHSGLRTQNVPIAFNDEISSFSMHRTWGSTWRNIDLTKPCTGTWCGLSNKDDKRKFSYVFRENKTYNIRLTVYKKLPSDTIKWSFGPVDPTFIGVEETDIVKDFSVVQEDDMTFCVYRDICNPTDLDYDTKLEPSKTDLGSPTTNMGYLVKEYYIEYGEKHITNCTIEEQYSKINDTLQNVSICYPYDEKMAHNASKWVSAIDYNWEKNTCYNTKQCVKKKANLDNINTELHVPFLGYDLKEYTTITSAGYNQTVYNLTKGINSFWLYDSDADDSTGLADGSVTNAVLDNTVYKHGTASYYYNANSYITYGNDRYESDSQGTIISWVKPTNSASAYSIIASSEVPTSNMLHFYITADPKFAVQDYKSGAGARHNVVYNDNVSTSNVWQLYTYSSSGTAWKGYVDAEESALSVIVGANNGNWFADLNAGTHELATGTLHYSNAYYNKFLGFIDDTGVWNRQLSDAEILYINNSEFSYPYNKYGPYNASETFNLVSILASCTGDSNYINISTNSSSFVTTTTETTYFFEEKVPGFYLEIDTDACSSVFLNVTNVIPTIITSTILPASTTTTDDLQGNANATQLQGYDINYYYRWYRNGTINETGYVSTAVTEGVTTNIINLSSGNTTINDEWIFSCLANYSTYNSSWLNSSAKTISGTTPVMTTPRFTPSQPSENVVLVGYCNATDDSGGVLYYNYEWYKDTVLYSSGSTTTSYTEGVEYNIINLSSSDIDNGDSIILSCQGNNTGAQSDWENSTATTIGGYSTSLIVWLDGSNTNRTYEFGTTVNLTVIVNTTETYKINISVSKYGVDYLTNYSNRSLTIPLDFLEYTEVNDSSTLTVNLTDSSLQNVSVNVYEYDDLGDSLIFDIDAAVNVYDLVISFLGTKLFEFQGYVQGEYEIINHTSDGYTTNTIVFQSSGIQTTSFNYSALGRMSSTDNCTFQIAGSTSNDEAFRYYEGFLTPTEINSSDNDLTNVWMYDNFTISAMESDWTETTGSGYDETSTYGSCSPSNTAWAYRNPEDDYYTRQYAYCTTTGTHCADTIVQYSSWASTYYDSSVIDLNDYDTITVRYYLYANCYGDADDGCPGGIERGKGWASSSVGLRDSSGTVQYIEQLSCSASSTGAVDTDSSSGWTTAVFNKTENLTNYKLYLDGVYSKDFTIDPDKTYGFYSYASGSSSAIYDAVGYGDGRAEIEYVYLGGAGPQFTGYLADDYYDNTSTFITKNLHNFSSNYTSVLLTVDEYEPDGSTITYYVSQDHGATWVTVAPSSFTTFPATDNSSYLKIYIDSGTSTSHPPPHVKNYLFEVLDTYPSNIAVDAGGDGEYEWNMTGSLNTTSSPQNVTFQCNELEVDIESYCDKSSDLVCSDVPINIISDSIGVLNVTSINITPDISTVRFNTDNFTESITSNPTQLNITFDATSGTLDITNVSWEYFGNGLIQIQTYFPGGSEVDTKNVTARFSDWDYDFPQNIDYLEFIPKTPTTKNVTPYGQSDSIAILNITMDNGIDNMNFSIYLDETIDCVNLSMNTSSQTSGFSMCYQETATTATDCGGLSTGAYYWDANWDNWMGVSGATVVDGNWATGVYHGGSVSAYVYMNYTKPAGALITSLWQIKNGINGISNTEIQNVSFTTNCFAQSPLQLRGVSYRGLTGSEGDFVWECYNGTAWHILAGSYNSYIADQYKGHEEGIYWNISTTTTTTSTINVLQNSTWYDLATNKADGDLVEIWMWADFACDYSEWRLWEPEFFFRGCCVDCVCSEDVS